MDPRATKFRQAALFYALVGVLYEGAVFVAWRGGFAPTGRGPVWLWLGAGAVVLAVIVWGLWFWRNAWLARALWLLNAGRVIGVMAPAFVSEAEGGFAPAFYQLETVMLLINMWMLARAGWDL